MRRVPVLPMLIGLACVSLAGCGPGYVAGYSSDSGYAPRPGYAAEPSFAPNLEYASQPMFLPSNGFYAEREYHDVDRYRGDRDRGWQGNERFNDGQQQRDNSRLLRQQQDYNRNLLAQQQHNAVVIQQQQYNQAVVAQQNAYNQALLAQQRAAQGR